MPARERIKKRLEFQAAQAAGKRVSTPHFLLLLSGRADEAAPPRLGIVASRKIGTSVARSRAKRLVREAFRATRDLLSPGTELVVIVRRPLQDMKLADVTREWREAAPAVRKRVAETREQQRLLVSTSEGRNAG